MMKMKRVNEGEKEDTTKTSDIRPLGIQHKTLSCPVRSFSSSLLSLGLNFTAQEVYAKELGLAASSSVRGNIIGDENK